MRRNLRTMQGSAGFTMIEIIVVILIIAILAAIAIPKFVSLTDDANDAAASATLGALRAACMLIFAEHQLQGGTLVTSEATLTPALEGGVLPEGVTGTYPDYVFQGTGNTSSITDETADSPCTWSNFP